MEASTYCIGLSEDSSSLQHIYWGPRIASEAASEMAHTSVPLIVPFESPTGMSREEYATSRRLSADLSLRTAHEGDAGCRGRVGPRQGRAGESTRDDQPSVQSMGGSGS